MTTERKSPAWPQQGMLAAGEEAETHFIALQPLGLKKKNKTQRDEIFKSSLFCFTLFNDALKGTKTWMSLMQVPNISVKLSIQSVVTRRKKN